MTAVTLETKSSREDISTAHGTMQLVSFKLDGDYYGLNITKVREIILITNITRVPETPGYLLGLINLRSSVIPVIDLRARFQLASMTQTDESRIMVLQANGKMVGIMVDAVSEVLRVKQEQIVPPPTAISELGRDYVSRLVKLDDHLLILLDIDKVLGEDEMTVIKTVANAL